MSTKPLIESMKQELIGTRFLVKCSIMDNGVHPESIMIAVLDLVDKGFKMKFFKDRDSAASFLKLLKAATN